MNDAEAPRQDLSPRQKLLQDIARETREKFAKQPSVIDTTTADEMVAYILGKREAIEKLPQTDDTEEYARDEVIHVVLQTVSEIVDPYTFRNFSEFVIRKLCRINEQSGARQKITRDTGSQVRANL